MGRVIPYPRKRDRTIPRNLKQLREAFEKTGSYKKTTCQALCFIADELVKLRRETRELRKDLKQLRLRKREKRKPSAYNLFIRDEMKKGLSMAAAVAKWQKKKRRKKRARKRG